MLHAGDGADFGQVIDANGILQVMARDARTGKEQSVEVKPSYGLSEDQVEAMIRDSFEKAEEAHAFVFEIVQKFGKPTFPIKIRRKQSEGEQR